MEYDNFITHRIDLYMGNPKSGKTTIAGSYPTPLLYVSFGSDGGGRVLPIAFPKECATGLIKVKNLKNDPMVNRQIAKTSLDKYAELLRDLRQPGADQFKTIVVDTLGGMQDDYKTYLEQTKGKALSQPEWGEVAKMMLSLKDNMKRFSEDKGTIFVLLSHTNQMEVYETSGLNKELRIIPDVTIKTGIKYMKDASNIFYCCRKTILEKDGKKNVKFLTFAGPHPLMDTGTRDMTLKVGDFIEDFTYNKWQALIQAGSLKASNVLTIDSKVEEKIEKEEE